jgi:uncharacterized membrane protein
LYIYGNLKSLQKILNQKIMENNREPKKRTAPIIWGAVLITVGLIWMLCATGLICLSFERLFRYIVPFSMIVCGIILLVKNRLYKIICLAVSVVLFILLLIFNGSCRERKCADTREFSRWNRHEWRFGDRHHRFDTRASFDVELKNGVVKVEIAAGAVELKAGKTTDNYLDVYKNGELKESFTAAGEKEVRTKKEHNKGVELETAFNTKDLYDIEFALGAANAELNLAEYKVKNVEIEMGASNVDLTLGNNVENVTVKIESGAGSATIRIPKSSRCSVQKESFLTNKEFDGFIKDNDGVYKTDNFESAKNTVAIEFEGALSDLKIERY